MPTAKSKYEHEKKEEEKENVCVRRQKLDQTAMNLFHILFHPLFAVLKIISWSPHFKFLLPMLFFQLLLETI